MVIFFAAPYILERLPGDGLRHHIFIHIASCTLATASADMRRQIKARDSGDMIFCHPWTEFRDIYTVHNHNTTVAFALTDLASVRTWTSEFIGISFFFFIKSYEASSG